MSDENGYITISAAELKDFAARILEKGGFTGEEARCIAQSLVLADLMGYESHGVIRVPSYLHFLKTREVVSPAVLQVLKEGPGFLVADAGKGAGQVQMPRVLERLIPKAKNCGVATAAIRNCGHIGRLGEWCEILARENLVSMITVNDNGAYYIVAPPGGVEPRISTNPMAYGIPRREDPFIFDFSTSVSSVGKVRVAYVSGQELAEEFVQDSHGQPTKDPSVLFTKPKGAIRPMAGFRGFGLGLVVDFLTAGLSGGFCPPAPKDTELVNNVVITAWDPELFSGLDHLVDETDKLISFVREARPLEGQKIQLPGDASQGKRERFSREGISLRTSIYASLEKGAQALEL